MSQRTTAPDVLRLHVRDRLAADGTPALSERFLSRLDRCLAATRQAAPAAQPLTLNEGLARLQQECPLLAATVDLCCIRGQTQRAAALTLGVDQTTAGRWRRTGVAQLVVWCGLGEQQVEDALGYVDKRLALLPHVG